MFNLTTEIVQMNELGSILLLLAVMHVFAPTPKTWFGFIRSPVIWSDYYFDMMSILVLQTAASRISYDTDAFPLVSIYVIVIGRSILVETL